MLPVDVNCTGNLADQSTSDTSSHKRPDGPEKNHCHTLKPLCAKHELSKLSEDSNSLDGQIAQPHSLHVRRIIQMEKPAILYMATITMATADDSG